MLGSVSLVVRLKCFVEEEDGLWVAGCPSLDVFSQGDSEEEARASIEEAVKLWFESCLERNTLTQAMQELGFRPIPPGHTPAESEDVIAMVESPTEILGQPFEIAIEIPAYQAAMFSEPGKRLGI